MIRMLFGKILQNPFYKFSDKTTDEVVRSLTKNETLIKVLTGQYGDYGLPPKQSSFAMHASVVRHYFDGGSFPVGGSSQILKTIDPVIATAGGTILVNAEVQEIIVKNDVAIGVKMKDGNIMTATNIVSNAGIMTTYNSLLPKAIRIKHHLNRQLKKIEPSVAHISLYLGLKGSPQELNLPKTNYWILLQDGHILAKTMQCKAMGLNYQSIILLGLTYQKFLLNRLVVACVIHNSWL